MKSQGGFSLLEVVISMAILTVGLISLLSVFGIAISATQGTQQDMIAKQLADEALESIVTARNSSQMQWSDIQNQVDGGIFIGGFQPVNNAGTDGIMGTGDDSLAGPQTIQEPGPDGIYGTSDDVVLPMTNYQRQIEIQQVNSMRSVNITIKYSPPGARAPKTYVLNTFLSQYR